MSEMHVPVFVPPGSREVTQFDPAQTREKLAVLDGDIVTARQLKDWPKLVEAVNAKIGEQDRFVKNWQIEVRGQQPEIPLRGFLSVAEAEAKYGIPDSAVSRWRISLRHPEKYHERIMRGSMRAAGLIDEPEHAHQPPVVPFGRFSTIVVDPPWPIQKIEREVRPNQAGFDYPVMDCDELLNWRVANELAAIPEKDFKADMADPMWHPSTAGLIQRHEARNRDPVDLQPVDPGALWLRWPTGAEVLPATG